MRLVEGIAEIDDLDSFLGDLDELANAHGCTVQAFDARYVVGERHLQRAVDLADRAIERGENVARERGVEILLYAAGRRQINRALEMGVSEGEMPIVVLVDEPPAGEDTDPDLEIETATDEPGPEAAAADAVAGLLTPAETLGAYDEERVCEFFDIGTAERDVVEGDLTDLVLERVALLDVEK